MLRLITRLVYENTLYYVLKPWCTIYTWSFFCIVNVSKTNITWTIPTTHVCPCKYGKCQIHNAGLCMVISYSPPRKCRPSENHMMNPWGQLAICQFLCCNVNTGDVMKLVMPVYRWAWMKKTTTKNTPVMIFKDMCFLDIKYICLIVACDLTASALQYSNFRYSLFEWRHRLNERLKIPVAQEQQTQPLSSHTASNENSNCFPLFAYLLSSTYGLVLEYFSVCSQYRRVYHNWE